MNIKFILKTSNIFSKKVQFNSDFYCAPKPLLQTPSSFLHKKIEIYGQDVCIWKFERAFVSSWYGGGIIDEANYFHAQFSNFPWGVECHPLVSIPYRPKIKYFIDKGIFLVTPEAKSNYYHWIVDLVPRLLILRNSIDDFDERTIIIHSPLNRYQASTFEFLKIKNRVIQLKTMDGARVSNLVCTDLVHDLRQNIKRFKVQLLKDSILPLVVETKNQRKIYVVRGNQKNRRIIGEEKLVEALRGQNIEIVDPSKITIKDQIQIFYESSLVISPHGAGLTNILFCRKSTKVIEIRSSIHPPAFFENISIKNNLKFDNVVIDPEMVKIKKHLANKQNLELHDRDIKIILDRINEK